MVTLRVLNTGWLITFGGELNRLGNRYPSNGIDAHGINRAAVIDEAFKLDDLRNEVEIDRRCVSTDDWFDFQRHTSVSRLPILRRRRRHDYWNELWRSNDGACLLLIDGTCGAVYVLG